MAPTTLQTLLPELLHLITSHLSYATHLSFTLTCKTLHTRLSYPNQRSLIPRTTHTTRSFLTPPTTLPPKPYTMADLLEIELWPAYRTTNHLSDADYSGCHVCLRLRSPGEFTSAMIKGERGKYGSASGEEKGERVCVLCGVETGLYMRGARMEFGGGKVKWGFVCRGCIGVVRSRGAGEHMEVCEECWGPGGWSKEYAQTKCGFVNHRARNGFGYQPGGYYG